MRDRRTILVAGGGIVGAAAFDALVARDHDVTLIERGVVASGATAWSGGVVRCTHGDPELSDRAVAGVEYFRGLAARTGADVPFRETGYLYFPTAAQRDAARAEAERLAASIDVAWLEPAELRRRFGDLLADTEIGAVYEPRAGFIDGRDATRALVRAGVVAGGRLLEGVELLDLERRDGSIAVRTSAGVLHADQVVIACGVRTPALLDALGVAHDLYVQDIQVDLRAPAQDVAGHPAFIDDVHDLNGRPDRAGGGVLVGLPTNRRSAGVEAQPVEPEHSRRIVAAARRRFAWIDGSRSRGGRRHPECYAPGGRYRVHAVGAAGDVVVATGFNGGGLKMAPWAADEIARLLDGARTTTSELEGTLR